MQPVRIASQLMLRKRSKPVSPIVLVGSPTSNTVTGGNTLTIPKPAGVVAGNLLVAMIESISTTQPTALSIPSGWVQMQSDPLNGFYGVSFCYGIAQAGDPSSYAFVVSNTLTRAIGGILAFANVNIASPLDTSNKRQDASSTSSHSTSAITPANDNSLVVFAAQAASFNAYTYTGGLPTDVSEQSGLTVTIGMSHVIQTTKAAVTANASSSGNQQGWNYAAVFKNG